MQGIGTVQWQDVETEYPLKGAGNLSGIFCDASFVTYDNFTPVLTNISIANNSLILSMLFDDGVQIFTCSSDQVAQGNPFRLRTNTRTYGTLVFGRSINDIMAGVYSDNIAVNIPFESTTIRTINSSNGLYAINGLNGNVTVTLDNNMWYSGGSLYAVSVPSNLTQISTLSSDLYLSTSSLQLIQIDPLNSSSVVLTNLDRIYTAICNTGTYFIGAYTTNGTTSLYNLNSMPASKIISGINYIITGLTVDGGGNLYALAGNYLLNLGPYPYSVMPSVSYPLSGATLGLIIYGQPLWNINAVPAGSPGQGYTIDITPSAITYINGTIIVSIPGQFDYSTSTYFSSQFYSLTLTDGGYIGALIGTMIDTSGNNHLPNIISMTSYNGSIYGIGYKSGTGYTIYKINPVSLFATEVITYAGDTTTGNVISMFMGGNNIVLNPIVPLKTVNSVICDAENNIAMTSANTLSITAQNNDTLVFSLPVENPNLNVQRTITYN